ncbi:LuxR C-terminal-related transcriptional regulator [Lentzea sp. NBRC 105346]|uniref:LuxR C-terminal-related transcriptional regulator n=1 Tax=Lentzea sp. NBRC 105346 TaxID=3032205 RepID=UPI0025549132|nr:LuxR C-terminal-related transcriptional regulator [Lentzea sp. NBRC 105346]
MADVAARLARPSIRLVTLAGVGGIGKTRLALRAADAVADRYDDGAWLVDLAEADTDTASHVCGAIAAALKIVGEPDRWSVDLLAGRLAGRKLLLLLDNCEHVLAAVRQVAYGLLVAAAGLDILATSREKLGIYGERVIDVPPLSVRGTRGLSESEAVRLLVERAESAGVVLLEEDLDDARRLCTLLDGLPLAIELAAGRLMDLSLVGLVDQLGEEREDHTDGTGARFDLLVGGPRGSRSHHQTLRRTFEWSRARLTVAQQRMWVRLAAFRGGFTLDAAQSVCSDVVGSRAEGLEMLTTLIRQSIVGVERLSDENRYRMLETVRQYAMHVIGSDAEIRAARDAHADYYRTLVRRAALQWISPDEVSWMLLVRQEWSNIRAAITYLFGRRDQELAGAEMAVNLSRLRHWAWTSIMADVRQWLQWGIAAHPPTPTRLLVRLLANQAWIALTLGRSDEADVLIQWARSAAEVVDEPDLEPLLLYVEGTRMWLAEPDEQRAVQAVDLLAEASARIPAEEQSDRYAALYFEALAAAFLGDTETARAAGERAQLAAESHGAQWSLSWTWWARGMGELLHGEMPRAAVDAIALFQRGLRMQRDLGDMGEPTWCLWGIACAAAHLGDAARAARLLGASRRLQQVNEITLPGLRPWQRLQQRAHTVAVERLGETAYAEQVASGAAMPFADAVDLALTDARSQHHVTSSAQAPPDGLTRREFAIAQLVAAGKTSEQIGADLAIAASTVDRHVFNLRTKLGLPNRTAIASWLHTHVDGSSTRPANP